MPVVKQPININFSQGLDTKSDPWQIPIGKFQSLVNSVFTKAGLMQKRYGFGSLPTLPDSTSLYCTTFNGNLTAIGERFQAFSGSTQSWVDKGTIQPIELGVLPLVRNSLNQSQADSVIAPSGLICTAYTETNNTTQSYKYVVADSVTGQNITAPADISDADPLLGTPRVFLMEKYFIIVYTSKVVSTYHLKFIAISISNPEYVTSSQDISTEYTPASTLAFDGVVMNGTLYLAWNASLSSGIKMAYVASNLAVSNSTTEDGSDTATIVSVCADVENQVIWASYYSRSTTNGYAFAVDPQLSTILLGAQQIIDTEIVSNISSAAASGVLTVLYELSHTSNGLAANLVSSVQLVQSTGDVGAPSVVSRSVGLASKAFMINDLIYFLSVHSSPYQPTYFLMNESGDVIAKIAYGNGGGYCTTGTPSVTVHGTTAQCTYLFKDLISSVNKNTNVPSGNQVSGVYSQTGINLVTFNARTSNLSTAEIGSNLNVTGGFLWAYDGYLPNEQGFFLWPESLSSSTNAAAVTPTGTVTTGSNVITAVSALTGVGLGALVSGTGIPADQIVTGFTSNTITFGPLVATGTHSAETITVTGNIATAQDYYYQGIYSWTDNQGNAFRSAPSIPIKQTTTGSTSTNTITFPTLRLTYKASVKLALYRWSTAQQTYYEVTSIASPTLNDPTVDSVTIVDSLSDASILGNAILYTTGGVVENIGPPACSALALFDDRIFLIDAENPNLLWLSKQVIESTPVEMSDLLTIYVAPTLSAQGSTGNLKCLGAMDDKLILFKKDAIYYINGTGPDNTGANSQYSQPIFITSSVGCENPQSIVLEPQGLVFESDKGKWLLGRDLSTQYIGAPVEAFNSVPVTSAVGVPGTNQIRMTSESGLTLMHDYYYQQWGTFSNAPAVSSTLYQGAHTYISQIGQVFQETPNTYLDGATPVLMSFKSGWINLAGLQGYQRAYYLYLIGTYLSPHKLVVQIAFDYNPSPIQTLMIQPTNFSPVYGQDLTYGSGNPYGGSLSLEQWRIFFKQQRCQSFQISVSELYDPSYGVVAGPGLTLSGMNCVVGIKKGYKPMRANQSIG